MLYKFFTQKLINTLLNYWRK